jgi:citrate lyase alpha subunit
MAEPVSRVSILVQSTGILMVVNPVSKELVLQLSNAEVRIPEVNQQKYQI